MGRLYYRQAGSGELGAGELEAGSCARSWIDDELHAVRYGRKLPGTTE